MRLYFRFFGIHIKAAMQYKISFLLTMIGHFLFSFNVFLGMVFLFHRFHEVKGYRFNEVVLCYATVLMSYAFAEMFMRGFDMFATTISNSEFDRILLRPRSCILQVVSSKIEFTRIGRIVQAVVMFIYGIALSQVPWDIKKSITLLLMVLGGSVIFGCLFLLYASICFFTTEGLEFMNVLTDGAREYGKYPLDIYGKAVFRFCTYLVPYTLFQYYPFLYVTGRSDQQWYMILPVLSCLFILPCYLLWRIGIKHYKSIGS